MKRRCYPNLDMVGQALAASARSLLNVGDKNELIKSSHERVSLPEREDGSESSLHF